MKKKIISVLPITIFVGVLVIPIIINYSNPGFDLLTCVKEISVSAWIIMATYLWIRDKWTTEKNEKCIHAFSKRLDEAKRIDNVEMVREFKEKLNRAEIRAKKLEETNKWNEISIAIMGMIAGGLGIVVYLRGQLFI